MLEITSLTAVSSKAEPLILSGEGQEIAFCTTLLWDHQHRGRSCLDLSVRWGQSLGGLRRGR